MYNGEIMSYTIEDGVLEIDISFNDYDELEDIRELEEIYASLDNALNQLKAPIHKLKFACWNLGVVGPIFNERVVAMLNSIKVSLEKICPHIIDIDFNSSEDIYLVSHHKFIFDFINEMSARNQEKLSQLRLGLNRVCRPNVYLTKNFFKQFALLNAFNFKSNFLDEKSIKSMMNFIEKHRFLRSIDIDLRGSSHTFDLREVLKNKHLEEINFTSHVLYPCDWDTFESKKQNYWSELGQLVKTHPSLTHFSFRVLSPYYKEDIKNIGDHIVTHFIDKMAYNRSLDELCVQIIHDVDERIDVLKTDITKQHFLSQSSLVSLKIHVDGHIIEDFPELTEKTKNGRERLFRYADALDAPDKDVILSLEKYMHHFFSRVYQTILNNEAQNQSKFVLNYVTKMFASTEVNHLPMDLIDNLVLSFLKPKDLCKLSIATGGFFHQKKHTVQLEPPCESIKATLNCLPYH